MTDGRRHAKDSVGLAGLPPGLGLFLGPHRVYWVKQVPSPYWQGAGSLRAWFFR